MKESKEREESKARLKKMSREDVQAHFKELYIGWQRKKHPDVSVETLTDLADHILKCFDVMAKLDPDDLLSLLRANEGAGFEVLGAKLGVEWIEKCPQCGSKDTRKRGKDAWMCNKCLSAWKYEVE